MEDFLPSCPHAQHDGKRAARFTSAPGNTKSKLPRVSRCRSTCSISTCLKTSPGTRRLTLGFPRSATAYKRVAPFLQDIAGSKPSTTEDTIIAEGPARCEVDSFKPVMFGSRSSQVTEQLPGIKRTRKTFRFGDRSTSAGSTGAGSSKPVGRNPHRPRSGARSLGCMHCRCHRSCAWHAGGVGCR